METCKLCGTPLDPPTAQTGLCDGCDMAVSLDTLDTSRSMRQCEHYINSDSRHHIRLYHCLLLVQKAKWLRRYERLGIATVTPAPSEWIARYTDRYDEIVMERIFDEVDEALARAEHTAVDGTFDTHLNAALQTIEKGKGLFLDTSRHESLTERVMDYLYSNMLALTV